MCTPAPTEDEPRSESDSHWGASLPAGVESIQPIVLVGGRSSRFGRNKLVEPVVDGVLVERPIRALREVFGQRVALVGECEPVVRALGDIQIPDRYPGRGPAGGILSALEFVVSRDGPDAEVFVLAGDLPRMTRVLLCRIIDCAKGDSCTMRDRRGACNERAAVVAAKSARGIEPCIAIYRPAAMRALSDSIANQSGHSVSLRQAIESLPIAWIDATEADTVNVNRPSDLTP